MIPRRSFLKTVTGSGVLAALGDLGFLTQLPSVSAAEAGLEPRMARFHPEIEPLVCLIEEMPRDRVLEEVTRRVKHGLNYRELLAALLLAGVRNIQPRPVGYKSHAVLVVNSAHLASLASPDTDRWLPIFWAIDQFKASQADNAREGDWTMGASGRKRRATERLRKERIHCGDRQLGRKRGRRRSSRSRAHRRRRRVVRDFLPIRGTRFPRHRAQGHLRGQQFSLLGSHRLATLRAGAALARLRVTRSLGR